VLQPLIKLRKARSVGEKSHGMVGEKPTHLKRMNAVVEKPQDGFNIIVFYTQEQ
jgi:hypothetical protein